MTITFYKCTAEMNRVNKSNYLASGVVMTGTLKAATSVQNPVIIVESSTFPQYNYCYITDFTRYYFIDEVTSVSYNMWQISMSVDVLMSYAGGASSGIRSLYAFVTRNENTSTAGLVDVTYPAKTEATTSIVTASPLASTDIWHGSSDFMADETDVYRYVWRVIGKLFTADSTPISNIWPMAVIMMDGKTAQSVSNDISSSNFSLNSKTIADYSLDMYALPCGLKGSTTSVPRLIKVAGSENFSLPYSSSESYQVCTYNTFKPITTTWKATITTPGDSLYQNYSPYTSISVVFMPFGKVQLDTALIFDSQHQATTTDIYFKTVTDPMTGSCMLYYGKTSSAVHYLSTANVMLKMPMSSAALNGSRIASSAITIGAAIASAVASEGATAAASAAAVASGVLNLADACATPATSITGGDIQIIDAAPKVVVTHHDITDEAPALFGKPYCKYVQLNGLTGFTKVSDVHIEGTGFELITSSEIAQIDALLREGVIL